MSGDAARAREGGEGLASEGVMIGSAVRWTARGVVGLALVVLSGCSSPSEVVIAVQTDFELTSDTISTIEIRVWRGNDPKFFHAYEQLGTEKSDVRLPITLGLVAEEEPGAEVRVQAIGWAEGAPQIVRDAVTTIPRERVALLHMPLQFLCIEPAQGVADPLADVVGRCGQDKTCVAGECVASRVDSASLPDYAPEAVFGGSAIHGGSACFDVARCFDDAEAIEVSALVKEGCSFRAPGPVNVALETDPDGVCGVRDGGRCLVALDAGTEAGFLVGEDSLVTLPSKVCTHTEDEQASKVRRVVWAPAGPAGDACSQKTQALPLCGPWSVAESSP